MYLWQWFFDISSMFTRVIDAQPRRIPPSEYLAWAELTGNIVYPSEYAILREMDVTYCSAMNAEISEAQARQRAEAELKAKSNSKR